MITTINEWKSFKLNEAKDSKHDNITLSEKDIKKMILKYNEEDKEVAGAIRRVITTDKNINIETYAGSSLKSLMKKMLKNLELDKIYDVNSLSYINYGDTHDYEFDKL